MPKKNSVAFNRRPDPPFIAQFKQRLAYKEPDTVDTKKQKLQEGTRDLEREDEEPQIVQLKAKHLSEEEYKAIKSVKDIEDSASSSGKILFKKPSKRQSEDNTDLSTEISTEQSTSADTSASISATTIKKLKKLEAIKEKLKTSDSDKIKGVNNKKLLSFGEEEEEEDN